MHELTWAGFDVAVQTIADAFADQGLSAVCGIPRGGLPLAVAISHRLGLPLVYTPAPGVLLVDDIHDSGRTLADWRIPGSPAAVWVTREAKPADHFAVLTDVGPGWFTFPWEDPRRVETDMQQYKAKR